MRWPGGEFQEKSGAGRGDESVAVERWDRAGGITPKGDSCREERTLGATSRLFLPLMDMTGGPAKKGIGSALSTQASTEPAERSTSGPVLLALDAAIAGGASLTTSPTLAEATRAGSSYLEGLSHADDCERGVPLRRSMLQNDGSLLLVAVSVSVQGSERCARPRIAWLLSFATLAASPTTCRLKLLPNDTSPAWLRRFPMKRWLLPSGLHGSAAPTADSPKLLVVVTIVAGVLRSTAAVTASDSTLGCTTSPSPSAAAVKSSRTGALWHRRGLSFAEPISTLFVGHDA